MIFKLCSSKARGVLFGRFKLSTLPSSAVTMSSSVDKVLSQYDPVQVGYMKENCILVNEQDEITGAASKKDCHLLENINKGMLHRAFSVFLFNSRHELLLQQRASSKITFPDHFTNTCCSHPLNVDEELDGVMGVKRAARRKLQQELGIKPEEVPLEDFHFITRVHYQARNVPEDGMFGEHEIDYILFIKRDVNVTPNENEVQSYNYVNQQQLKKFLEDSARTGTLITPWFRLITDNKLYQWWDELNGDLSKFYDHHTIHRL